MLTASKLLCTIPIALLLASCGPPPEPNPPVSGTTAPATSGAAAAACVDNKADCDGDPKTVCETELQSSAAHCGACGKTCGAGETCSSGACKKGQTLSALGGAVCAIEGGKVYCWGDNSDQAIDGGSKGPRATPVAIPGIAQATSIQLGRRFGCAITADAKVSCFRGGKTRELSLLKDVTDIAIQSSVLFVVQKNGELSAFDLGFDNSDMGPTDAPPLKDVVRVEAGGSHACALHKSGEVTCWGDTELTGSGVDHSKKEWEQRQALEKEPTKVKGLVDAVDIAVSSTHSCVIRKNKQIACWGSNWSGELGDGSNENQIAPVAVKLIDDAANIAVGYHHTCAQRASGKVVCWGENRAGQLGSAAVRAKGMVEVQGISNAISIAGSDDVSCAQLASGGASCWGSASRGRLGNGQVSDFTTPQKVNGLSGTKSLTLGERFSCSINEKKQLVCWGLPGFADENADKRGFEPRTLTSFGELDMLSMRGSTMCGGNDKAKTLFCESTWDLEKGPRPLKLGAVKAVISGGTVSTALLPSGQVVLWARSDWNKPEEVQKINMPGLADAVTIAYDSSTVCGVRRSGKVGCGGFHYRTFDKKDPVKPASAVDVPGITDAVKIVNGGGEYCVLRKSADVACFSSYRIVQAIDPKQPKEKTNSKDAPKPQPIEVKPAKGVADAADIAVGGGAYCALSKQGTVMCWGSNSYGQLGLGDYDHRWEATTVSGISDVSKIALGGGQTCALKKNEEVWCWGRNISDEAGQSTPPFVRSPVAVNLPK